MELSLWEHLDRSGGPGACWLWQGYVGPDGYGRVMVDGKPRLVHRISFIRARGPIPTGLVLDHLCRVRSCANPAHLEPVTQAENVRRGESYWASKAQCPQGHPYDDANTYVWLGSRACRICSSDRKAEWQRRNRDLANQRRRERRHALAASAA